MKFALALALVALMLVPGCELWVPRQGIVLNHHNFSVTVVIYDHPGKHHAHWSHAIMEVDVGPNDIGLPMLLCDREFWWNVKYRYRDGWRDREGGHFTVPCGEDPVRYDNRDYAFKIEVY